MSGERSPERPFDEIVSGPGIRRRDVLKILGGGIVIVAAVPDAEGLFQETARGRTGGQTYPTDFNAYLRIGEDGRVTCYTGKIEQGQGAVAVLPLMLAEELEIDPAAVDMVLGDTDLCPYDSGTFGSQTVRIFGPALRAAAAEARVVLVGLGAEKLGLPVDRLEAKAGTIRDKTRPEVRVTYAELAHGQRIEKHVEAKPALKPYESWTVMGRAAFRRDARDKVTGRAEYAGDVRRTEMLYARVLRPPAHGAKIKALDTSAAERMPGVRVFRDGEFVAVLHRLPDGAEKALSAVKAEFDLPPAAVDDTTIHDLLLRSAPETRIVAEGGSLDEGAALAEHVFERTYFDPYVAHAPMEPHTALVEVKDGKATAWISTQAPFRARDEIAQTLNFDPKDVRVIVPFVGGGFGGKTRNLQAVQAARLAKAVGRPVQVAWTRADEFFNDTFRPASVVKIRSGMTSTGKIVLWDYQVLFAGERSSRQFYDITHHRTGVRGEWMGGAASPHPFGVGAWRAPASNSNTFARESQIDIMAATAGIDPVTFRLLNLNDLRMQKVLKAALERFGWRPDRAPSGRGVGVACADYLGTYVATLAEVEVVKETGEIKVKRVVCAQDMGQAINPEGARLQIEGCVTMGLGYSLAEEVHFRGGEVRDLNFDTYEIPRFSWVPRIETVLLDSPELAPSGGGEPAIITMGAVLANAVFDATGARITRLPLTRARVQEARKNL